MGCANSKLNEAALSALVVSQNWDGAMNHMDEASTAEVFYQDPEDENRTALMQGEYVWGWSGGVMKGELLGGSSAHILGARFASGSTEYPRAGGVCWIRGGG